MICLGTMVILVRWSHCLQINSWWQHLRVLQAEYRSASFIFPWGSLGRGSALSWNFFTEIMIIYCILEMNEHEHKRLIWRLKHNRFLLLFKEMSYSLRCSMRHKLVVYKVLINVFMASSMFPCLYLNKIFEPILILLQFLKVPIL